MRQHLFHSDFIHIYFSLLSFLSFPIECVGDCLPQNMRKCANLLHPILLKIKTNVFFWTQDMNSVCPFYITQII